MLKTAKNYDGHKKPIDGAQIEENFQRNGQKSYFRFQKMKRTESPKLTSKFLYELLIRSYARFKYFSRTWNLTIFKSKSVNQRKCEHHGKIIFSCEKIQKMEHPMVTNDLSLRCKLRNVFKKIFVKKIWFYVQKYEKNWKSKNDLKSPLRALNKELWAI